MIRQRKIKRWSSAAARRLCALTEGTTTVEKAVVEIAERLLHDIRCPPTDLDAIIPKLNVLGCEGRQNFAGSGALTRADGGYKIVYSSQLSFARKRWTIAHELGHAVFETTGPNPPRHGRELERLCDMIATELLLPRRVFLEHLRERTCRQLVLALANVFQTSVSATSIRCAELCGVSVFETVGGRFRWGYGHIRHAAKISQNDELARLIQTESRTDGGTEQISLSIGHSPHEWLVDWKRLGDERRIFMLRTLTERS